MHGFLRRGHEVGSLLIQMATGDVPLVMTRLRTIRRTAGSAVIGAGAALALVACGGTTHPASTARTTSSAAAAQSTSTSTSSASLAAGPVTVSISGYAFHPATITVAAGTRVTFTNHDQTAHTATTTGVGFDTGTVAPGKSATVTLRRPGTYAYVCQFHAFMHGTIVVRAG
jgi:plastocyanin